MTVYRVRAKNSEKPVPVFLAPTRGRTDTDTDRGIRYARGIKDGPPTVWEPLLWVNAFASLSGPPAHTGVSATWTRSRFCFRRAAVAAAFCNDVHVSHVLRVIMQRGVWAWRETTREWFVFSVQNSNATLRNARSEMRSPKSSESVRSFWIPNRNVANTRRAVHKDAP